MRPGLNTYARNAVRESEDLRRVLALVRRPPLEYDSPRARALVSLMTERLRRPDRPPGSKCGCASELGRGYCLDTLLPEQAWTLYEAPLAGGIIAPLIVGGGKTGLDVLMAMVMRAKTAVLFLPPRRVKQFAEDYRAWAEHFVVPSLVLPGADGTYYEGRPVVRVIPYSMLSRPESTDLLERVAPDLIIADEIHRLKDSAAARTRRFLRYFVSQPGTNLCGWSGTITSRSITDFAHLMAFALGEGSPVPLDPEEVERWATAVDPVDCPSPPGALKRLCEPGEDVRAGFSRRIRETRGVVFSSRSSAVPAELPMRERRPPVPAEVLVSLRDLRRTWQRPDGEELIDAMQVAACGRQLSCGFYYRWVFSGNPTREDVVEWRAARGGWNKESREKLKRPQPFLDSPMLLANAAERARRGDYAGDLPTWRSWSWDRWRAVKDTIQYDTEAVWISDFLAADAAGWALANTGVVWYGHAALGARIAALSGLPQYGGGLEAEAAIRAERGERSIIASIKSHGEGLDGLQRVFWQQLVVNPPSSGADWEQLLGRLHRQGQAADEVLTWVYRHTAEMAEVIDSAVRLAKYIEGVTGANQKLLASDVDWALGAGSKLRTVG